MRTRVVAGIAAGLTAAALVAFLASIDREPVPPPRPASEAARPVAAADPRLYCEFYNFASRTPKVGFYFTAPAEGATPRSSRRTRTGSRPSSIRGRPGPMSGTANSRP